MKITEKLLSNQNKNKVAESISLLPEQLKQVLADLADYQLPKNYRQINRIVVAGMGGSNLAGRIAAAVFADDLAVPLLICADYDLPAFVDRETLVVLSSYSGNTEETLAAAVEAEKRNAKVLVITAAAKNNKLANAMISRHWPGYLFTADDNPSGQPRLALGYTLFGLLVLLAKLDVINLPKNLAEFIIDLTDAGQRLILPSLANPAVKIARAAIGKQLVLVGGEFLSGNLHAWRNQCNETAKNFATYLVLPDLNHYALEGLKFPANNKKDILFIFIDSVLYSPRVQKRSLLTQQVVKKNQIKSYAHQLKGKTKLAQSLELLQLGAWMTFYLAQENKADPSRVPMVDWFKDQLK